MISERMTEMFGEFDIYDDTPNEKYPSENRICFKVVQQRMKRDELIHH